MASIFTYDPDPPRVASPWLRGAGTDDQLNGNATNSNWNGTSSNRRVTRLEAEPQEGPVEYKLHLLLRPRRRFRSTSTGSHVSGSKHSNYGTSHSGRAVSETALETGATTDVTTPSAVTTQQNRQHRLQQLTTQLLWRLQQSSPHHTSSATNIILPSLPEALPELQPPHQPAKLLHGLEESQGALYEIGVSDDGTLVGLAEDELQESLNNLRAMAACLGCTMEVLRKETVGSCEWVEDVGTEPSKVRRSGALVVAEASVKPHLQANSPPLGAQNRPPDHEADLSTPGSPPTEQLRITLTGPTMCGKSSLLGTLTTSTLDNGRGKSRLSMLKHRHEITSGITSSVTQELLGYQDSTDGDVQIINYATENVASWIDVHIAAAGSRLAFISDSAGHPRYRRTTVRSLVGWSPHWTLLCVPADDTDADTSIEQSGSTHASQQSLGGTVSELDLSSAQLDLCLRLRLRLVIVITKLDLASRSGLKTTLSKVLDALKAAGRRPAILSNTPAGAGEPDLQRVAAAEIERAYQACLPLLNDDWSEVPIVFTSAVQGTGIQTLHALIHELPLPGFSPSTHPRQDTGSGYRRSEETSPSGDVPVFHVEDIYSQAETEGIVVSGRNRSGRLSIGNSVIVGPFSGYDHLDDSEDSDERPARRPSSHLPTSRSFPGALRERDAHLGPAFFQLPNQEWRRVKISSIRNLRLPVHTLLPDQVGTLAITPADAAGAQGSPASAVLSRVRKGMILTTFQPVAARSFVAEFDRGDLEGLAVGNHVVVYIASVRASARIVSARAPDSPETSRVDLRHPESNGHDPFSFEDMTEALDGVPPEQVAGAITAPSLLVTFRFDAAKEFIMAGDQILVMPGGGPGLYGGHERGKKGVAGLEGFVGAITETFG